MAGARVGRVHVVVVLGVLCVLAVPFRQRIQALGAAAVQRVRGRKTIAERVAEFGPAVRARLAADLRRVGAEWPPDRVVLVGLKAEKRLEVWVGTPPRLLRSYPMLGASGVLGPKRREGDCQVPEGLYRVESLNPNSLYHLALRLDYPNEFDRQKGERDGRTDLGSDIMIHGRDCSIGCLAMGDPAAEDLFVLAAETGVANVSVILAPVDFRIRGLPTSMPPVPSWTPELYARIRKELHGLGRGPVAE